MEYYTIREMTRRFSLPASTLRYYEQEGLLPPVGRTQEGQRIYDARHAGRLETIACFKGTGMTIAQLRQLFRYEQDGDACIGEILALLRDQRDHVRAEIEKMQETLTHVERKICRYEARREELERGH